MNGIIKILVVERESVVSRQLKQGLNRDQIPSATIEYIIFMVSSISGAADRLKYIFFDIVLVDVHQGWNDQEDYLLLRSITWMAPKTKIILLAPEEKQEQARNVEGLTIAHFIPKPWEYKDLVAAINYLREGPLISLAVGHRATYPFRQRLLNTFFLLFISLTFFLFPLHLGAAPYSSPAIKFAETGASSKTSTTSSAVEHRATHPAITSTSYEASIIFEKAVEDMKENRLNPARQGFEELIFNYSDAPETMNCYLYLAEIYEKQDLLYEATAIYNQFAQRHPGHPLVAEALIKQGEIALRLGEVRKAEKIFKQVLFQYPGTSQAPKASFLLGDSLCASDNRAAASLYYDDGMKQFAQYLDDHPQTAFNIGHLALQDKRFDQALSIFLALEKNYPQFESTSKAVTFCGDIYVEQGKIPEAILAYQRTIDNYPDSIGAQVSLIRMADLGVEYPKMVIKNAGSPLPAFRNPIQAYRELLQNKTADLLLVHLAEYKLGLALQKNGDHKGAIASFQSLLAKAPQERIYQDGLDALKQELVNELNENFGKKDYLAVIKIYEGNKDLLDSFWHDERAALPYFRVAQSYQNLNFYPPAIRLYQYIQAAGSRFHIEAKGTEAQSFPSGASGRTEDPLSGQISYQLGQIFFQTGEYQKAVDSLRQISHTSDPLVPSPLVFAALSLMGDSYWEKKDYTRASEQYLAALMIQPLQQGQGIKQLFRVGQCYEILGKIPEAIQFFSKAADLAQEDKNLQYLAQICLHLADCQYKTRAYAEALKSYQKVESLSPTAEDRDWVFFQIGNCSLKKAEPKVAQDAFKKLKENNQDTIWPVVSDQWSLVMSQ